MWLTELNCRGMIVGKKMNITLEIVGRTYSVTIPSELEDNFRLAKDAVQERLEKHKLDHPLKDQTDWLVYVLIEYIVAAQKLQESNDDVQMYVNDRLNHLDELIKKALN
jgi:cell division protein ZapA (FtsZ GTPase activity inhibitor)